MTFPRLAVLPLAAALVATPARASTGIGSTAAGAVDRLAAAAPGLDRQVLALGLRAHERASRAGQARRPVLAIVDYRLPSSARRLWVLDLQRGVLLFHERVAHGRGSDGARASDGAAVAFSNQPRSHATSLGVFATAETYVGRHGPSLRLDGLEAGVNDAARRRAIVIHGADYVTDAFVREHGRAGRSHGCPAVDPAVAPRLIDALAEGAVLFAYHPEHPASRRGSARERA